MRETKCKNEGLLKPSLFPTTPQKLNNWATGLVREIVGFQDRQMAANKQHTQWNQIVVSFQTAFHTSWGTTAVVKSSNASSDQPYGVNQLLIQ